MRLIAVALGIWGCASSPSDPADPLHNDLDEDPMVTEEPTSPTSPADLLQEAEALTAEALGMVLELRPDAVEKSYDDAMALGDMSCPSMYTGYWFANCDATTGASFDGFAFEFADDGSAGYGSYWYIYGEAMIGKPDGGYMAVAGNAGWGNYDYAGMQIDYHYAYGTFTDDGANNWLGDGLEMGLFVEAGIDGEGDQHIAIDGTVGGLGGEPGQAVDFLVLRIDDPGWIYATCGTTSIAGEMWVRSTSGTWLEVDFGERCDNCADVYHGAEHLGEACFDSAPLLDWEVTPW